MRRVLSGTVAARVPHRPGSPQPMSMAGGLLWDLCHAWPSQLMAVTRGSRPREALWCASVCLPCSASHTASACSLELLSLKLLGPALAPALRKCLWATQLWCVALCVMAVLGAGTPGKVPGEGLKLSSEEKQMCVRWGRLALRQQQQRGMEGGQVTKAGGLDRGGSTAIEVSE